MAGCFFGKPPFNPFGAEFAGFVFFHIVVLFPPPAYPFPGGRALEASVWERGSFFLSILFSFIFVCLGYSAFPRRQGEGLRDVRQVFCEWSATL